MFGYVLYDTGYAGNLKKTIDKSTSIYFIISTFLNKTFLDFGLSICEVYKEDTRSLAMLL